MKKFVLFTLLAFTLVSVVSLSSCSDKKKDIIYDLTVQGTATTLDGSISIDYHFTDANAANDVRGEAFAKVVADAQNTQNAQNGIVDVIETEIKKLFHWETYDVTVNGYVKEKITGLKVNIEEHYVYPHSASGSAE